MSFSFKLRSHVKEGEEYEDGQLLVDHLTNVTDIALQTNDMHGIDEGVKEIIRIICMCHDFGKASEYFQQYLQGQYNGKYKNHGEISAYFAYSMLPDEWKLTGFMCVKRHHGNLEPDINFFDYDYKSLNKIAESIKKNIKELNKMYGQDVSIFFELIKDENFLKRPRKDYRRKKNQFTIEDFIYLQYIWSLLLTGDKTQLIRGKAYENDINIYEAYVKKHKEKIRDELIKKIPSIEKTQLFQIRNQIYEEVIQNIKTVDINKDHVFSINVPTGTGKTLSVYGGAFELLQKIYKESNKKIMPTIIYTIPFTSVIDQNYEVLEEILKTNHLKGFESFILKHHSMTELKYIDYNKKTDEEIEYKDYDARFCVENWQSTIITTTFVQLFHTIFQSGINGIIHRFHKLAGAIIILDEVQAIPPKYYDIIEKVFKILCKKFRCYVITVTATKPLFLEGEELVKSNEQIFKSLDRIQIENYIYEPKYIQEFCQILLKDIKKNEEKSFLIVLNTIKSSLQVLDQLNEFKKLKYMNKEILYLSTEIHPQRRLEIIQKVKDNKDKKYILVSTQLIEAGVDIDFDIVYRDFSTIDSINQTAGRANRNAVKGKGIVRLFYLMNENHSDKKFATYIYSEPLLDATEEIIKDRKVIQEKDILEINKEYFKKVQEKRSKDPSKELEKAIRTFNFKAIRELFQLIEKDYQKEDVVINYNEQTKNCLDKIENGNLGYQEMINVWRQLNKYKVSVNKKDLDSINCISIKGMNVLDKKDYDENRGIIRKSYEIF